MSDNASTPLSPLQKAFAAIQLLKKELDTANKQLNEPIAIIGMSCRAPGAKNSDELWDLIRAGKDAISDIPSSRWNAQEYYDPRPGTPGKAYTLRGGFIENVDKFCGIVSKSNFSTDYTDLSPAFNFDFFQNKLKNE